MAARRRVAASSYVEVFILIAVAAGGSGAAYGVVSAYPAMLRGPSVSILSASIAQGSYLALERVTVYNSGQVPVSSFTVATAQSPASASFCYSLIDPRTVTPISSTCPALSSNPGVLQVAYSLASGKAVLVELYVTGTPFRVGSSSSVTVTTSAGGQATYGVTVGSA